MDIKVFHDKHDKLDVADLLVRLAQVVRRQRHSGGLRPVQWEILRYLCRANRPSRCPGSLALYLGTTRGTVSQTLITLEKKGLLSREKNVLDGRGTLLNLTPKGRRMATTDPLKDMQTAVAGMPGENTATEGLLEILRAMQKHGGWKAFGVCRNCDHFRRQEGLDRNHLCAVTNEMLSEKDSHFICREFISEAA